MNDHRVPVVIPGSQLFRLAMPMLYAAMGISLGTLAGTVVALNTTPITPQNVAADVTTAASALVAESHASAAAYPAWAPKEDSRPAAVTQPAGESRKPSSEARPSASSHSDASASDGNSAVKPAMTPASQSAPKATPAIEKNMHPRVAPEEKQPAQPAAHPVAKTPRMQLASASTEHPAIVITEFQASAPVNHPATKPARAALANALGGDPAPMMDQMSFNNDSAPPVFYSEGDLTVADYDAANGTIQSSDGRTFFVGPTVAVNDATSWEDYRAGVHYRCDQNGSCTLNRPGVVARNAKLI